MGNAKGASPKRPGATRGTARNPKAGETAERSKADARTKTPGAARNSKNRRFAAALRHHRESATHGFVRLFVEPLQSVMTALVIAIALALPAALYVLVASVQQMGGDLDASARITVFLHRDTAASTIETLRSKWAADAEIADLEYIPAATALEDFKVHSGFGDVLDLLDENPLPPVLLVNPAGKPDAEQIAALAARLEGDPRVDSAQLDMLWLKRLNSILTTGRQVAFALAAVLALGVLLIIGNTIRLAVESRREEILVVKLVGGTDAFVRRPFLYNGLWYGASGGLLSWVMVALGCWWLNISVERLAALYQSQLALVNPGIVELAVLVCGGGLLGVLGAWLAVGRHVAAIEP